MCPSGKKPLSQPARAAVIRSRQDEKQLVHVSVTDRGIGISDENADQLFNAFFTTKSTGIGMGLSICRSIIEAHGGRISAANNDGPGATFQFTLPLHQSSLPDIQETAWLARDRCPQRSAPSDPSANRR